MENIKIKDKVDLNHQDFNRDYCTNFHSSNSKLSYILTNNIFDCIKLYNNQYIILNPIFFNIYPSNNKYSNNDKICIKSIRYSYDYIGLSSPLSFYLCNNKENLYSINDSYYYEKDSIPREIQNQINMDIKSAKGIIDLVEGAKKINDINEKFKAFIDISNLLGELFINSSNTFKNLIEFTYPLPAPDSLEDILKNIIYSIIYIANANYLFSTLLKLPSDLTKQSIALNIYNSSLEKDSAVEYVLNAINSLENYINEYPQIVQFITAAKNIVENLKIEANEIFLSPAGVSFDDISIFIINAIFSASNTANAFAILVNGFGTEEMKEYLSSIIDFLYILYDFHYSVLKIKSAQNAITDEEKRQILNENVAPFLIATANRIISALDYSNVVEKIYLYNTWKSTFYINKCNYCLKNINIDNSNKLKVPFREKLNSFKISNLVIEICGTIGDKEFSAISNNEGIVELTDLELQPINIKTNLLVPKNLEFSLIQNINSSLIIDCIIPTKNYDINNPNIVAAELNFNFNVETNLLVTMKKILPVYVIDKV